jgi:predicted nuclease of predicted toxin-antitoxin system
MKLLFDESLSPRLVELLRDLFPQSESALRNGLAGGGDLSILEYASASNFILVSTDGDFKGLLSRRQSRYSPILQLSNRGCGRDASAQCDPYRSAPSFQDHFIILDR